MEYNNLYTEFKNAVPESEAYCILKEKENFVDETDGMHICFGMVVMPYIFQVVLDNTEVVISKAFDFLEEMALSSDVHINELLDFTVLEQTIDEGQELLEKCKKHMKPSTKQHCEKIEEYFCQ